MTRDREVNLGDLNEVTVDEPRANTSRAASGGNGKKAPPGSGKPAPKPQKPASSGGGNGGWMAACLSGLLVRRLADFQAGLAE